MQFDYDMALADKLLSQYLADNPDISVENIAYSGAFYSNTSELSDEDAALIGVQAGYLQRRTDIYNVFNRITFADRLMLAGYFENAIEVLDGEIGLETLNDFENPCLRIIVAYVAMNNVSKALDASKKLQKFLCQTLPENHPLCIECLNLLIGIMYVYSNDKKKGHRCLKSVSSPDGETIAKDVIRSGCCNGKSFAARICDAIDSFRTIEFPSLDVLKKHGKVQQWKKMGKRWHCYEQIDLL